MMKLQTTDKSNVSDAPKASGVLQRQCACGQHTVAGGECDECGKKQMSLQRKPQNSEFKNRDSGSVPLPVNDVLRSPGQPLDDSTRSFMEPRFGHDFSRVRTHTDGQAARSARDVNALAYTVGQDVVFGSGQYAPATTTGRQILAHELAHVVQQNSDTVMPAGVSSPSASLELAADSIAEAVVNSEPLPTSAWAPSTQSSSPLLMRRVASRLTRCTANARGAPDDPVAELTTNDARARDISEQLAQAFADDAREARGGIPDAPSATFQSYQDHFGLPGPEGRGFLNRLTGIVRPSQEIAMSEELRILSRRYGLVARLYGQVMSYICIEGAGAQFGGCGPTLSCDLGDAQSCRGVGAIFLCPTFWTGFDSDGRAGILLHEAMHIILGPTDPGEVGQIGDETLRGAGRNFNIAGCYEAISNDVFGINSGFSCPAPP